MFTEDSYRLEPKPFEESQDSLNKLSNNMQQEEADDAEETLSFCDLPIYSDASEWEYFTSQSSSSSSFGSSESSSDQDYFEFSQELSKPTISSSNSQPQNIIFCGKLIPYKQPVSDQNSQFEDLLVPPKSQRNKNKKRTLFKWKWISALRTPRAKNSPSSDKNNNGRKLKMSILTSPGKSKWYLYLFGMGSFPATEMELRDIKRRQSRRSPSRTMFQIGNTEEGGDEYCSSESNKGLWRLMRALSLGGDHRRTAGEKGSSGCIP